MPTRTAELRALIGGKWAVSWQGYLLASPFGVGTVFMSVPSIWDTDSVVQTVLLGLVLGVLAYIPAGLVFWLAGITVLRNRERTPVPIWLVALTGAMAWAARSLVVIAYVDLQNLDGGPSAVSRILLSALQGVAATLAAAWLMAKIDEFAQQRRMLLNELVDEELANETLSVGIQELRSNVHEAVRRTIHESLSQGAASHEAATTRLDIAEFREQSRRVSRDLAHELWASAERTTRLGPKALVRFAVANRPFAYWALLPGVIVGLLALPSYWPGPASYASTFVVTVYALVVSALANRVTPRMNERVGLITYAVAVVLLLVGGGIVWLLALDLLTPHGANAAGAAWLVAATTGIQYPILSLAPSIGRAQADVLTRIRRSIDATEIRRASLRAQEARVRRELAVALHGGLQADLTAASMRAQQAMDARDAEGARQVLLQALIRVDSALDISEPRSMSLQESVDNVVQSWSGLARISSRVNVAHEPSAHVVSKVHDVLLEGIGNAVRHANAKSIDIEITGDESHLCICVTDDGRSEKSNRPGLGSSMLDDIAPNAWSLEARPYGGSVLDVLLSIT